jgi:hypothetical protein
MKMRLLKCVGLTFGLLLMSVTTAKAQETTLTFGVPEIVAANGVSATTISTADVDLVLRSRAPSLFGQNFTRDKANKVFADFANYKLRLTTSLIQAIQTSEPSVTVNSLLINTNTLNLQLAQKINNVSARLGTVSASIAARKRVGIPLFCTSANVSFSLDNIMVSGDYNFITGDVSNAAADFVVNNVKTSCNGLLSFVGDLVLRIAGANSILRDAIRNEANNQLAFVNMKQLFSLSEFARGLNYYRNDQPLSLIANRAISFLREIVDDAAINTPNIVLDFKIETAASLGALNKISIFASHSPATIDFITVENEIQALLPANSERTDFYYRAPTGTVWTYFATAPGSEGLFDLFVNQFPANTRITAVSRSATFPGLQAFPSNIVNVKRANPCGPQAC